MMDCLAYQERLRAVVLDRVPTDSDLGALGAEAWRWLTYRRMVRNRLFETIEHCFGRLSEHLGPEDFRELVDAFLAERGSSSQYLRDLPREFFAWLEDQTAGSPGHVPPYAIDLARLEWAELSTAYAPDPAAETLTELVMDRPAVVSSAHRLLWLRHPVHLHPTGTDAASVEPRPVVLCLYRDARTFEVHTLELSPVTGALLCGIQCAQRPLADVIRSVANEYGAVIDGPFLEALSAVLADLVERRVILGSLGVAR